MSRSNSKKQASKLTKRTKAKTKKQVLFLKAQQNRLTREKSLKEQLGLNLVGYYQQPFNGRTAEHLSSRCVRWGDWERNGAIPKGDVKYHIQLHLVKKQPMGTPINLTEAVELWYEVECDFNELSYVVHQEYLKTDGEHFDFDSDHSYFRVRY